MSLNRIAEKKIVTLICATGILSCGACFLPPLPAPRPAPPPIFLDMQGVRTIAVEVSDDSAEPRLKTFMLDTSRLAAEIALQINEKGRRAKLNGAASGDAPSPDGTLKVSILSEGETVHPGAHDNGYRTLEFHIVLSAVLTRKDGAVLWTRPHEEYWLRTDFVKATDTGLWKKHGTGTLLTGSLGAWVVDHMLSGQ